MTLSSVTPISFILTVLLLLSAVTPALSIIQEKTPAPRQLSSDEKQAQSHAKAGQQLYKSNKLHEAIAELKKAVELQPKNPEYRNQLATAHFHNNDMKQMWSELRQGAQLDPSHKLIAKGLLAYWDMMDRKGLFNVGTEASTVESVLGKPDQALTNRRIPDRMRMVYGFLAAEFRDGKLHETLDLRGLKPEHFVPQEIVVATFDGRGWEPGYRTNNQNVATAEWTLPNEKIQAWTELVTIQRIHSQAIGSPSVDKIAIGMMDNLKRSNPDRQYRMIENDADSILFEWKTAGNEKSAAQHEIVRLFKGQRDIHRIAYVQKIDSLSSTTRSKWIGILRNAKLKPIGKSTRVTKVERSNEAKRKTPDDRQMWQMGRYLSVAVFAHARKQRELAKANLLKASKMSREIGFQMVGPFQLTNDTMENVTRAIDYLVNDTPAAMREAGIQENKIATYELITRTFSLAMVAADQGLVEKSMIKIREAAKESELPESLIAALNEKAKPNGATPDQIRAIIQKLHADAENILNHASGESAKSANAGIKNKTNQNPSSTNKVLTEMETKIVTLGGGKRAEITSNGEVWINGGRVGSLTADGEVWVEGDKEGELSSNGDVWKAGNRIGTITDKGEVWLMGSQLGSIEKDGSVYMSGSKIGSIEGQNRKGAALVMFYGFFSMLQ